MEKKRKIPYGVMNWGKIVCECHFVDNTGFIRNLEPTETPVFLRPKRFGKSVVCSMLAHYYDVNLKDRFEEFFGGTDIGREPTPLRNAFLVLTFDFSTITVGTLAYRAALLRTPGWTDPVDIAIVEVYSHTGYRWLKVR